MKNQYRINEGRVYIQLKGGHEAVIDVYDLPLVKSIGSTWYLHHCSTGKDYVVCNTLPIDGKRKQVKLHRLITGVTDSKIHVDHKDGNTLHNYRDNLRTGTQAQNNQNAKVRKDSVTGVRGVSLSANGTYKVRVYINGKRTYLGTYKTLEEANKVATEARREHMPYSEV